MEKMSSINRVVGNAPQKKKEQILKEIEKNFNEQSYKSLKSFEREKSAEEVEIINLANELTNQLRRSYGLNDFNVPLKNIHVIPDFFWPRSAVGEAMYIPTMQAVFIMDNSDMNKSKKVYFFKRIIHEILHFKSYNALQTINTGAKDLLDEYRMGLIVKSRKGDVVYFSNFNEAVTEEMTKRIIINFFSNPSFVKEAEQTERADGLFSEKTESNKNFFLRKEKNTSFFRMSGIKKADWKMISKFFSYGEERENLNLLMDKIVEKNSGKFKNKEEVLMVFAKGMITGNILPLGRLLDRTFGKGIFRKIGELDKDMQKQKEFINSL